MEVKATTTVRLDEKTQKQICISFLRKALKFREDYYIKDGKVIHSYSYRSWTEEHFIRDATEEDYALEKVLKALQKESK